MASHDEAARHVDALSAVAAVCLLAIYGAWLWGYLRRRCRARPPTQRPAAGAASVRGSVGLLAVAGIGAAFASDWFVSALEPAIDRSASRRRSPAS